MKILMFYAKHFECRPYEKVLEDVDDFVGSINVRNSIIVFYHVEPIDEDRVKSVVTKLVKNIKWIAGKFGSKTVVIHSFNHLATKKGGPELAKTIISGAVDKLKRAGYILFETPFGYQNEWIMHVAGESLAKVFKEL